MFRRFLNLSCSVIFSVVSVQAVQSHKGNTVQLCVSDAVVKKFIQKLPKAELHVHIEGTMEPEQLIYFAHKNGIQISYTSVKEARQAYAFTDFASFCVAYNYATTVLCTEQDFYDLAFAYLKKAAEQGVVHAEIFFDLQTYMPRNMGPDIIVNGLHRALTDAHRIFGISGGLIMCFLRHLSEEDALKALELSLPFKDKIVGVGLACQEEGNPPCKFQKAFEMARSYGYRIVAHEGESVTSGLDQALNLINVERLDHGIQVIHNTALMKQVIDRQVPLTVCPLSNVVLNTIDRLENHPLKKMLEAGVFVTINSDDPAFFGGYIAENYYAAYKNIGLSLDDLITCARNSIEASFIDQALKEKYRAQLDDYVTHFKEDVC